MRISDWSSDVCSSDLQAQGLTASAVNQQLRQVNLNAAGGKAEIAGSEQAVRVLGNAQTAYDLGQTQIAVGDGRTVKLADLGEVKDLYAARTSLTAIQNGRAHVSTPVTNAPLV